CGVTTCLAFAAKLASGEAAPDLCPFLTHQTKVKISMLTMPPVKPVSIASSTITIEVGGEEGLFRHDGGFRKEARLAYAINLSSNIDEAVGIVSSIDSIIVERMGSKLSVDFYLVDMRGIDLDFIEDNLRALRTYTCKPLILRADNLDVYLSALSFLRGEKPAIVVDPSTIALEKLTSIQPIEGYPIVVLVEDTALLSEVIAKMEAMGMDMIILGIRYYDLSKLMRYTSSMRIKAIEGDRRFGYPILVDLERIEDRYEGLAIATVSLLRYSSIVVLPRSICRECIEGLLVFKQSIYTDPRKPRIVYPGIYSVGSVSRSSPTIVTSNYALTFDIVRRILESTGIGCWILAIDTGGLSVASAIGGGRFTARQVVEAIQACRDRIDIYRTPIVIPGLASSIKPEIEALGFDVLVGPVKARDLPAFIRSLEYG
ncbi:MAG: (Fe-S)-binding protein, partial [Candidatus Bathyarchaeia archaeon]